ncbi:2-pyrone-4,6-dicarbaxylate hydrolase [Bordetella sputigena]|uniref:amidohydrolase family protein n=1 Tax=Bordetella sputigena TaxID=1416810 RepID=UPI0039EFAEF5
MAVFAESQDADAGRDLPAGVSPSAGAPPRAVAIDTHAHVFEQGLTLAEGRRYSPGHDATLADYLAQLDAHGMTHGVLVQPSFLGMDNRYLLDALRACPARLRGVVVIDPGIADDALRQMAAAGVMGMRLNLFGQATPPLDTAPWRGLLARVTELGWHVELHVPARRLPDALPHLLAAGCTVVVDHFGRPDPALGVADAGFQYLLRQAGSDRVWVKLSGAYRNWSHEQAATAGREATRQLLDAYTAARLVWGSDWPHTEHRHITYEPTRHWLDRWIPHADTRRIILGDAPSRLFRIDR